MKPAPFCYAKARSLKHALELLGQANGEARVLAGGQSLIAALNLRLSSPRLLVDINGLADLDTIDLDGDRSAAACRTMAPSARRSPSKSIVSRSASPLMSTSRRGLESRRFNAAIRL